MTQATDMKFVTTDRATLVLHFGISFSSPAISIFKLAHFKFGKLPIPIKNC